MLVKTTVVADVAAVIADVAAVEADVATIMPEVYSVVTEISAVVSNFYPIVTNVAIITGAALGLCGNGEEYAGGEENSQFRFHDLKF